MDLSEVPKNEYYSLEMFLMVHYTFIKANANKCKTISASVRTYNKHLMGNVHAWLFRCSLVLPKFLVIYRKFFLQMSITHDFSWLSINRILTFAEEPVAEPTVQRSQIHSSSDLGLRWFYMDLQGQCLSRPEPL